LAVPQKRERGIKKSEWLENLTIVVSEELLTPSVITDCGVTEQHIVQEATS